MQQVGASATLVADPAELGDAEAIVLPGVGSFGRCAEALSAGGWRAPLTAAVESGVPLGR